MRRTGYPAPGKGEEDGHGGARAPTGSVADDETKRIPGDRAREGRPRRVLGAESRSRGGTSRGGFDERRRVRSLGHRLPRLLGTARVARRRTDRAESGRPDDTARAERAGTASAG